MAETNEYIFGANILDNLTTAMYMDSRVIYREYIQNACDAIDAAVKAGIIMPREGVVEIYTNDASRDITIRDNGIGIKASEFVHILGSIANSGKTLGENKGFRGIGRLCGLAYCKTLIFSSKAQGETTVSRMICDAAKMRQMIAENQINSSMELTASEVLNSIILFDSCECDDRDGHWFEVNMISVNSVNHELLARESVIDYLSFVAPVPFNKNFSYRTSIYEYVRKNGLSLDEYVVKINGEQIFKDYRTHVKTSKGEDDIFDVQFHEIYDDDKNLIAWIWYGLRKFQAVIDKDCPQRGLRLRKENIQIGNEDALQRLFKEDRGTHYFIGEVHAVSNELVPNSQRDYFNENLMRNIFERETKQYFDETLYRLYHAGNDVSAAIDKLQSYNKQVEEFKKKESNGDFIDKSQRKEAEEKVERARKAADEGKKKLEKATERYKGDDDSPINKVVTRIAKERNAEQLLKESPSTGVVKVEDGPLPEYEPPKKKQKLWVDRLSSVNAKDRKLISRVCGIVWKYVDEETMEKIKQKLEEEFK